MSEEAPSAKLRLGKTSVSATTSGTYQCSVQINFEASTRELAESIIKKLNGLEIKGGPDLQEEALDILKNDVEQIQKAKEILIREHRAEIERHLQTMSFQTSEIDRLRKLEESLDRIANLRAEPGSGVVR